MNSDRDDWETVIEQEERSHVRIVDDPFCTEGGELAADGDRCEACRDDDHELATDGGTSTGVSERLDKLDGEGGSRWYPLAWQIVVEGIEIRLSPLDVI